MKKTLKIAGIVLASLAVLLLVVFLLARFVFRDQVTGALNGVLKEQRAELLRSAAPYAADTIQFRFAYRQDSVRAREIRNHFRLDTLLRRDASTWENTLALAKFVARNIPHANQQVYPEKCNAVALWEYSRTVEPAFNCRLHSIMLHELLLASGITNRFVTCLPADSLDTDCHVVNIAWLPELQKWAMVDSDMQAFITDPAGTPLSLAEMRARYIGGEPTEVHRLLDEKDDGYYAAYWAKNLYWFECWESTGFDQEPNRGRHRCVVLLPPDFEGFRLGRTAVKTSDETRFWAAPETASDF